MSDLASWEHTADSLKKTFQFSDFKQAIAFMDECAETAENLNHHPDWRNVYNRVEVTLTTHEQGGVTDLDRELAEAMDQVFLKLSQN